MKKMLKNIINVIKLNKIYSVSLLLVSISLSILVYSRVARADEYQNKIGIDYAKITKIKTGTAVWDSNDGLNGSKDKTEHTAGNDSNDINRIVRSFDTIEYEFEIQTRSTDDNLDLSDISRKLYIKPIIEDENVAKYVKVVSSNTAMVSSKYENTLLVNDVYADDAINVSIKLYVYGAPDNMEIDPKFEIKEETAEGENVVYLGKNDDTHYYEYKFEEEQKYFENQEISNSIENYMPTIVSSTNGFDIGIYALEEGQAATYNNIVGRYMSYGISLAIKGNATKGIKGINMPEGDIKFNIALTTTGKEKLVFEENWIRPYTTENVGDIQAQKFNMPYSNNSGSAVSTQNAGNISATKISDTAYEITINNYVINDTFPTETALGSKIINGNSIFGTYVMTLFSGRSEADGKNNITVGFGSNAKSIRGNTTASTYLIDYDLKNDYATTDNVYYEVIDYSLVSEFANSEDDSKLSPGATYGLGSATKGEEIHYNTVFNYNSKSTKTGIKEVIKVDPRAFRVLPYDSNNDVKLKFECDGKECADIKQSDFNITFVSGGFENTNYEATNYSDATLDARILAEDKEQVKNSCSIVNNSLSTYTADQIMNLYGGPCIKAKENVETIYNKISDAKMAVITENQTESVEETIEDAEEIEEDEELIPENYAEVPITKIIIETKEGVTIPGNVKITASVNLRVRNVPDITQNYQATSLITTSSTDTNIRYFTPRISDDQNSVTNPNNYIKTVNKNVNSTNRWGDTLQIINFRARNSIYTTNKNADGSTKTVFETKDNEVINYRVDPKIEDFNESVGADDVWYIKAFRITVTLPNTLEYIQNSKLGNPTSIITNTNNTQLIYDLPYTKANFKINCINFQAKLRPNLIGNSNVIKVSSEIYALNVNNEIDTSYAGSIATHSIYANGIDSVITSQRVNEKIGDVIEKNKIVSYMLSAYNNTGKSVTDFKILDILPYNGDSRKSKFSGDYKVKVILPQELQDGTVQVKCYNGKNVKEISEDVNDSRNEWQDCDITNDYVSTLAFRIENISIASQQYMPEIEVQLKTNNNKYSDAYANNFIGQASTYMSTTSNTTNVRVVSRTLSGRAFYDKNNDGIENEGDTYVSDLDITLCKLNADNSECKHVTSTTTDENGKYSFTDLDRGRYEIGFKYDTEKYDLTLRYATEDTKHDSDAFKVGTDGDASITNKRVPDASVGLKLDTTTTSIEDLNIGLIPKKGFEADIKKYITKVELNSNGALTTNLYNNLSQVVVNVKNSARATAKIYYGIEIKCTTEYGGYVKNIEEDIPDGLTFDPNENSGWVQVGDKLYNTTLADTVINPGETKYLQIVLNMPRQEIAKNFLNTVSILETELYDPQEEILPDEYKESDPDNFAIGEEVEYAGIKWNVIKQAANGDVTLLAQSFPAKSATSKSLSGESVYKWSTSNIKKYLDSNEWASQNTLNLPILVDNYVCDDPSGTRSKSFGGTLREEGTCLTNTYVVSKLRLLTETEYNLLKNGSYSWLYTGDFWLQNSTNEVATFGANNKQTNSEINNDAKYVSSTTKTVVNGNASTSKKLRPVIVINKYNLRVQP